MLAGTLSLTFCVILFYIIFPKADKSCRTKRNDLWKGRISTHERIRLPAPADLRLLGHHNRRDQNDMLTCLSAREVTFRKDEIIFSYGKQLTSIGIVLDGCVHILKEDFWGNANLMSECQPGDIFGEAYAINASPR